MRNALVITVSSPTFLSGSFLSCRSFLPYSETWRSFSVSLRTSTAAMSLSVFRTTSILRGIAGKNCGPTRGKQSRPSFSTRLIRPRFASTLSATKFWRWRELARDLSGAELINLLGKHYGYRKVNQEGSHVILETTSLRQHRIAIPDHSRLRVPTMNAILKAVARAQGIEKEEIVRRL